MELDTGLTGVMLIMHIITSVDELSVVWLTYAHDFTFDFRRINKTTAASGSGQTLLSIGPWTHVQAEETLTDPCGTEKNVGFNKSHAKFRL